MEWKTFWSTCKDSPNPHVPTLSDHATKRNSMTRSPRPGPSSVLCYPGRRSCSRPLPKQGENALSLDKSLFKRQDCYSRNWEVPIFSSYHSTPRRFHPISTQKVENPQHVSKACSYRLWAFSLGDPSQPPFSNPSHQRGVNPKCLSSSKRDFKKKSMQYRITSGLGVHNRITFTKFTPCGKVPVFPIFGMVPLGQPPFSNLRFSPLSRDTGNCWWPHPIHKVAIFHIHLLAHPLRMLLEDIES